MWHFTRVDQGGTTESYFSGNLPPGLSSSSKGGPNPGWKQYLGRRDLTTLLSGESFDYQLGSCHVSADWAPSGSPFFYHDKWQGVPPYELNRWFADPDLSVLEDVFTDLASKIYRVQRGKFAGGVFLGEISETMHMVRHPLAGVTSTLKTLLPHFKKARLALKRSRSSRDTKRILASFNARYLEFTFAIMPFVGDIQDLVARVKDLSSKHKSTLVHSTKTDAGWELPFQSETLHSGPLDWSYRASYRWEIKANAQGVVLNNPTDSGFSPSSFGLRLRDFVPTVWELIPYSFLVDYVTTVGSFCEATMAEFSSCAYYWSGCEAISTTTVTPTFWLSPWADPNAVTFAASAEKSVLTRRQVVRRRPNPAYDLTCSWQVPGFRAVANTLSILAQFKL